MTVFVTRPVLGKRKRAVFEAVPSDHPELFSIAFEEIERRLCLLSLQTTAKAEHVVSGEAPKAEIIELSDDEVEEGEILENDNGDDVVFVSESRIIHSFSPSPMQPATTLPTVPSLYSQLDQALEEIIHSPKYKEREVRRPSRWRMPPRDIRQSVLGPAWLLRGDKWARRTAGAPLCWLEDFSPYARAGERKPRPDVKDLPRFFPPLSSSACLRAGKIPATSDEFFDLFFNPAADGDDVVFRRYREIEEEIWCHNWDQHHGFARWARYSVGFTAGGLGKQHRMDILEREWTLFHKAVLISIEKGWKPLVGGKGVLEKAHDSRILGPFMDQSELFIDENTAGGALEAWRRQDELAVVRCGIGDGLSAKALVLKTGAANFVKTRESLANTAAASDVMGKAFESTEEHKENGSVISISSESGNGKEQN